MTDRKPSAGFWITVALVAVLVGYPLSFGPVCWITSHANSGAGAIPVVYKPIVQCLSSDKKWLRMTVGRFSKAGAAQGWRWRPARDLPIREKIVMPERWDWTSRTNDGLRKLDQRLK